MTQAPTPTNHQKQLSYWPLLILYTLIILWSAHAITFFLHEFGHSFTAWILGWKSNPLALNYGDSDFINWLIQAEIDENVDYTPLFAGSYHFQAGIIAAAGMLAGNVLISYTLSRWGFRAAQQRKSYILAFFFYWLCLDSVGNFIDYVPVRVFSSHGDIHTMVQGFHCSPWWILMVLGIPYIIALVHFIFRFIPESLQWLFPDSPGKRMFVMTLSACMLFGFYGLAGWSGYGTAAYIMSRISIFIFLPVMAAVGSWRMFRITGNHHGLKYW